MDQTMKKTIGTAVAGAVLCALALSGCHGRAGAAGGGGSAVPGAASSAAQAPGGTGDDGVPTATPTGAAAVDSELGSVDRQLGVAGTDLAQATQSPSDGD